jgi:hypothetical protein
MLRYFAALVLPAVLFLGAPASAHAQQAVMVPGPGGSPSRSNGLNGPYVNLETGGFCYVYPLGRGFLFVDDAAQRVPFAYAGAGRLRSVSVTGAPVPDITVTVSRETGGRIVLRFDAPGVIPGYWVSAS